MRIVEIAKNNIGAHNNQTILSDIPVPKGWAIIPDEMECNNFPFGEIKVVDGIVTSWTPGILPEKPKPNIQKTVWDELDEAYTEGVEEV